MNATLAPRNKSEMKAGSSSEPSASVTFGRDESSVESNLFLEQDRSWPLTLYPTAEATLMSEDVCLPRELTTTSVWFRLPKDVEFASIAFVGRS